MKSYFIFIYMYNIGHFSASVIQFITFLDSILIYNIFWIFLSGGVCHARQKEASPLPVAAALEAEYQAVIMSLIVHQELVGTTAVKMAADTLYVLSLSMASFSLLMISENVNQILLSDFF